MSGENQVLPEAALPFLQSQAVDCLQPDIVNSGGITGTRDIARLAALYRTPITLHNVSGLMLNAASQHLAAATSNCPRIECTHTATELEWATPNPLEILDGRMKVSDAPGLGVEIDLDWVSGHRYAGEADWH